MLWQSMLRWSLARAKCQSRSSTRDKGRLQREQEANVRRRQKKKKETELKEKIYKLKTTMDTSAQENFKLERHVKDLSGGLSKSFKKS